jgi:hypothetical protein
MPRWPFLALAIAAVTAVAAAVVSAGGRAPATGAAATASGPLLGVLTERGELELARLDPATLRPRRGPRLAVGRPGCAARSGGEACWSLAPWSLSPGRTRLAIARNDRDSARTLRVVDVERVRAVADVPLRGGPVGLVAWLGRSRLLALQEICCQERQSAVWIDAASRRVLERRLLAGSVLRVGRAPTALVMLAAVPNTIGPARLEVADADGVVRGVTLERVRAGVRLLDPAQHRVEQHVPGLAVDPAGRRAFVIAPGLVAEVDLETLGVSYHSPRPATSLLERLRDWLDPEAQAKGASGPVRWAEWLGDGRIAVTGADEERRRVRPAGLALVDTHDWTVRTLDPSASDIRVADGLLLATGGTPGLGLAAYGFDGRERFRLLAGQEAWVAQVHAGRAYVGVGGEDAVRVVDLAAGRIVGERSPPPWIVGAPASWWEI